MMRKQIVFPTKSVDIKCKCEDGELTRDVFITTSRTCMKFSFPYFPVLHKLSGHDDLYCAITCIGIRCQLGEKSRTEYVNISMHEMTGEKSCRFLTIYLCIYRFFYYNNTIIVLVV